MKVSQNSQGKNLFERDALVRVFPSEFRKIFNNIFFTEHLQMATFDQCKPRRQIQDQCQHTVFTWTTFINSESLILSFNLFKIINVGVGTFKVLLARDIWINFFPNLIALSISRECCHCIPSQNKKTKGFLLFSGRRKLEHSPEMD